MKKFFVFALAVTASAQAVVAADLRLWYRQPAQQWVEALPVGNGRLGAMVFGGVAAERLQLNEATLWSGGPRDWNNPAARDVLPRVRAAVLAGRYAEADALCRLMQGPYNQSYGSRTAALALKPGATGILDPRLMQK